MQKKNILNRFKDVLGQYCAINQFVELSKRCFIADYDSEIHTRNSFIELATQKEITLTSYDSEYMINAISRSYIVNVHLCFETFLKGKRQILMQSDTKLLQPFVSWSNSL